MALVLLVEDNDDNRFLNGFILSGAGHTSVDSTNPEGALELLSRHPVEVVVTDQKLPGMTGTQLLGRIYTINPSVRGLLATGVAYEAVKPEITELRRKNMVVNYLLKPYAPDRLLQGVELRQNVDRF